MKLSNRLSKIIEIIPKCRCVADIGTDHGYIPIYAVLNNISKAAIASDIKSGPLEIAKKNIELFGLQDKIELRIGPGLSILKKNEADVIVIAGMGGYTINCILNEGREIVKNAGNIILQPAKYPEVLRKYLFFSGFKIIDEDLVKEENKYYHIIKAAIGEPAPYKNSAMYYIGLKLIEKRHPLLKEYLILKINEMNNILRNLSIEMQPERFKEISELIKSFEDVIKCL